MIDVGDKLAIALSVWGEALAGLGLILVAGMLGWHAARDERNWAVRPVRWWLTGVLGPLLASRSWLRRAALIAGNNSVTCCAVVLSGWLGPLAWLAVAGLGVELGSALRLLLKQGDQPDAHNHPADAPPRLITRIAFGVNLLEVPAILLCAGLALAQGALTYTLDLQTALTVFVWVAWPLLLISAAAEATWMGHVGILSRQIEDR